MRHALSGFALGALVVLSVRVSPGSGSLTSVSNELSDLEHEIEETRQRLASTIDQLLYRSSPKTIVGRQVAAIKGFYIDASSGEPRTDNILKTAGGVVGTVILFVVLRRVTR